MDSIFFPRRIAGRLLIAAAATSLMVFPAVAQYAGPVGDAGQTSVKAILDKPVDDQYVKLQGHLLRKTGDEKYIFSDGTGEIVAEIDDDDFPAQKVDDKTRVEIVGEVDTGLRRAPEIDVDALRVIN